MKPQDAAIEAVLKVNDRFAFYRSEIASLECQRDRYKNDASMWMQAFIGTWVGIILTGLSVCLFS